MGGGTAKMVGEGAAGLAYDMNQDVFSLNFNECCCLLIHNRESGNGYMKHISNVPFSQDRDQVLNAAFGEVNRHMQPGGLLASAGGHGDLIVYWFGDNASISIPPKASFRA